MFAACYVVLTVLMGALSYGPIQVRLSESLLVLGYFFPEAVLGVTIGCVIANMFGGMGLADIIFGSFATFLSVYIIYRSHRFGAGRYNLWLGAILATFMSPIIVPLYLSELLNMSYPVLFWQILLGQAISILAIGVPLMTVIGRNLKSKI